jgi:hypothetical protein
LLIDAAAEAGAEIREGFTGEAVLMEGGRANGIKGRSRTGIPIVEDASVVIGAEDAIQWWPRLSGPNSTMPGRPALAASLHEVGDVSVLNRRLA